MLFMQSFFKLLVEQHCMRGTFFPSYRILSNKPAAGLIFSKSKIMGGFIGRAGLLEREGFIISILATRGCYYIFQPFFS